MLATLAMFVTGVAVLVQARRRARPATSCPSTRASSGTDMGTFALAYAIAIGAAFLPAEPTWPKLAVAALLILIYARYVKRHFEADPDVDARGPRAAPLPPPRPCRTAGNPTSRVSGSVNLQVIAALA